MQFLRRLQRKPLMDRGALRFPGDLVVGQFPQHLGRGPHGQAARRDDRPRLHEGQSTADLRLAIMDQAAVYLDQRGALGSDGTPTGMPPMPPGSWRAFGGLACDQPL